MKLTEIKKLLWDQAVANHGENIHLTSGHTDIDECILFYRGCFYFWFNTDSDNSTHLAKLDLTDTLLPSYISNKSAPSMERRQV